MPTKLTKDILQKEYIEMCREEMSESSLQNTVNQGIQAYAKLTEMAQETDSSVRAALFYTMSNYLDDMLKLYTKHGLGRIMDMKVDDDNALYAKLIKDGVIDSTDSKEFEDVYKTCNFESMSELSDYREASEDLDDNIKNFTNYNNNKYATDAIEPFLKAYDTEKLRTITKLVEKLSSGKEFNRNTFTKEERAFITIAAETAHAGFTKAMIWEKSEYFSKDQLDQIRMRVNMHDGKENDYSIPEKHSHSSKIASSTLFAMGTENIVMLPSSESLENAGFEIKDDDDELIDGKPDNGKTTDEFLLDNQLAYLNKIVESDTLSVGKFAVFSLNNSPELPKMTASDFIDKAKTNDTTIEQSQWAEKMTDAFLEKLNKNGGEYTIDNLMVDGKFIEGVSDTDKKEKFVAAALDGKKLDLAITEKNKDGVLTSGRTMPIQLNDCMEKSWSFIEWLKSLFGLDRESKVKSANESVRDGSKRQNNLERIKVSFEDLLDSSSNNRKTVKSQSAEKDRSLEKKSPDDYYFL